MNARTLGLLCVVWATGCVLPDYEVRGASEQSATKDDKDAGSTAMSQRPATQALREGADDECERCVVDSCQAQRSECGDDCGKRMWPVSPAWRVTDSAKDFVKCLAMRCEDQCKVTWGCNGNYTLEA